MLASGLTARADTFTWTGAATANWNNSANWTGGGGSGVPGGGAAPPDSVAFTAASVNNLGTNNDIGGLTINAVSVTTPAGPVSIVGNAFTLGSGGFDLSAATQDLSVSLGTTNGTGLNLAANQTWNVAAGRTLTVSAFISAPASPNSFGITKTGGGTLSLPVSSNNTGGYGNLTTALRILGGTVTMPDGNSLGSVGGSTVNNVIIDGGALQITIPAGVALNANRGIGVGANGGTIDIPIAAPAGFQINGIIADVDGATLGRLTKTGTGLLILNAANTFRGGTTVSAGTLAVRNIAGLGAPSATVLLQGSNPVLHMSASNTAGATVNVNGNVTVGSDATILSGRTSTDGGGLTYTLGTLSIGGQNLTIGPGFVTNNGIVGGTTGHPITVDTPYGISLGATTLTGNPTFTVNNNGTGVGTLTLGAVGETGGSRSLTKAGPGTLILNEANTYTGPTTISAGTLGGSGSIASATTVGGAATVAPGTSAGTLIFGGPLTVNGTYAWELATAGSPAPTGSGASSPGLPHTNHDVLVVGGVLDLTGASLTLTSLVGTGFDNTQPYSWTIATAPTIFSLPAISAVSGPDFAGLTAANFSVTSSGTALLLNYTPVPEPGAVLFSCGAGAAFAAWRRRRSS